MPAPDVTLAILPMWLTDMPPAGVAALSTYLRKQGVRVRVLDLNIGLFRRQPEPRKRIWDRENFLVWSDPVRFRDLEPALKDEIEYAAGALLETGAPVLAFSTVHPNRMFTKAVLARIRAADPARVLVVGGRGWEREPHRRIFKDGTPDLFVEGEGEETLVEIVRAVGAGRRPVDVPGSLYWDGSTYRWGGLRPMIADLDTLPLPTYEEFDLAAYTADFLPLTMTRGCVSRCAYCNDRPMSGRFRNRTGARVAEEVSACVRKLGASRFQFTDSAVNGNLREVVRFAEIVARSGLEIEWEASAMPRRDMTLDRLRKLAASGCRSLTYGIESGSDRVLAAMGRRWSAAEQARALRDTRAAGIETRINLIVGYPGETDRDFAETLDWLRANREWISGISNVNACQVLFPSALRLAPEAYGVILPESVHETEDGWTDSAGLDRATRTKRLERLLALVDELRLAWWTSNERRRELTAVELRALAGGG